MSKGERVTGSTFANVPETIEKVDAPNCKKKTTDGQPVRFLGKVKTQSYRPACCYKWSVET
ncbi:MAG: hypothetical protein CMO55_03440 [Verrucomicrobiales bacterium]|nr:hypothetical protein [Verrucomicrobiales bacterium]